MRASDLLVQCLEHEGVRHVFGPRLRRARGGFRGQGYRVESAGERGPALVDALAQPGPTVVDVPVDYGENARLGPARPARMSDLMESSTLAEAVDTLTARGFTEHFRVVGGGSAPSAPARCSAGRTS